MNYKYRMHDPRIGRFFAVDPLAGRTFDASASRYGFNGQEKVDEISGDGNHYTAQYWEYDPRLGRRWNQDSKPNPSISNYACFANNPIMYSDSEGDTIRAGRKQDQKAILKMINSRALGEFAFNSKGNL